MKPPQFPRRAKQPMTPESYRRAVMNLRGMVDDLEASAAKPEPTQAVWPVLRGIQRYVRHLLERIKL